MTDGSPESSPAFLTAEAAENGPFRLRLEAANGHLPRPALCRRPGEWECGPFGSLRLFTWYEYNGAKYLQDQDGYYLSHHWNGRVYTSSFGNAVAWHLEGSRLLTSAGLMLTWLPQEPGALYAHAQSGNAVSVAIDAGANPEIEKLRPHLKAIAANPPAGALFDPPPDRKTSRATDFFAYGGGDVTVYADQTSFGAQPITAGTPSKIDGIFNRLVLRIPGLGAPSFNAFRNDDPRLYLAQVYEHESASGGTYRYDFSPEAHDNWRQGIPIFRAIPPDEIDTAVRMSPLADSRRAYAQSWFAQHDSGLIGSIRNAIGNRDNRELVERLAAQYRVGNPKYVSKGAGVHGGYGPGTAGAEFGKLYRGLDAPQAICSYATQWVTFGAATGADLGASVDFFSLGMWFCETDGIEGACNGVTISAEVFVGASISLFWDGSWQGLDGTSHPIGITTVYAAGLEMGVGVFYNLSATEFFNKGPDFPKQA